MDFGGTHLVYCSILYWSFKKDKNKDQILKETRDEKKKKKQLTYTIAKMGVTSDFSSHTMQARREQSEIFGMLGEKKHQTGVLY